MDLAFHVGSSLPFVGSWGIALASVLLAGCACTMFVDFPIIDDEVVFLGARREGYFYTTLSR